MGEEGGVEVVEEEEVEVGEEEGRGSVVEGEVGEGEVVAGTRQKREKRRRW